MLMLALLVATSYQQQSAPQHSSNFSAVIQHPDPNNGYDDYVRATDVINSAELDACIEWSPSQVEQLLAAKTAAATHPGDPKYAWSSQDEEKLTIAHRLHDLDYLGVQRLIESKIGDAMAMVRSGNQKNVWDPREKLNAETTYPELHGFRRMTRLIQADAYARFADGDTKGAVDDLLQGLTFSRKIDGDIIITDLVSAADQAGLLAAFEDHLSQLSDRDAVEIAKYAETALAEPPAYAQSLKRERIEVLASIDYVLKSPGVYLAANPSQPTSEESALVTYLSGLGSNDQQSVKNAVGQMLGQSYDKLLSQLGSDESTWLDPKEDSLPPIPPSISTPQDAADALTHALTPAYDRVTTVVVRTRTQLRLLDLHARIIDFRWRQNRLPSELKEAVPETLSYDPLSKTTFVYQLKDSGYRLFSKGAPATGVVELRYRAPSNLAGQDPGGIPPPDWMGREDH